MMTARAAPPNYITKVETGERRLDAGMRGVDPVVLFTRIARG
jgi:hypothetical protein